MTTPIIRRRQHSTATRPVDNTMPDIATQATSAKRLYQVPTRTVLGYTDPRVEYRAIRNRSTVGRPRHLSEAQIKAILDWHKSHRTMKQVARQYGVSVNTIQHVIRANGRYKQCAPEERAAIKARRSETIARLKSRGVL